MGALINKTNAELKSLEIGKDKKNTANSTKSNLGEYSYYIFLRKSDKIILQLIVDYFCNFYLI